LKNVGALVFAHCTALTSVTFPESVKSVVYGAFAGCSALTSVTLSKSVETVGKKVFAGCSGLTSVTLPHALVNVGKAAFEGCTALTSVTLPHALVNVGKSAFRDCTALTSVAFRPPVSRGAFIAWAVGSSRNRTNWALTTVKRLRNVLRLVTALVLERRDVVSLDPDGSGKVFKGCPCCVIEYDGEDSESDDSDSSW